jgi:hypothetical protein
MGMGRQVIFLYDNLDEKVLNDKTGKYLIEKPVLEIDIKSDFELFISNSSNWKSTKLKITTSKNSITLWTQDPDKYFEKLSPVLGHKIVRG